MLVEQCSEQVVYMVVTGPEEIAALKKTLPPAIAEGLESNLERESTLVRYDAASRCAHLIMKQGAGAAAWLWSGVKPKASKRLLAAIDATEAPMTEQVAVDLYDFATREG
jgi:hypothetical protein